MRLLFDEQLSEELCRLLNDILPDSLHVRQIGAGGFTDEAVWQLAKERDCLLVTKDEDFHRLSVLRGAPPSNLASPGQLSHRRRRWDVAEARC